MIIKARGRIAVINDLEMLTNLSREGSYILDKAVLTARLAVRSRRYESDLADLPRRRQSP
jgi:hypothetical protein